MQGTAREMKPLTLEQWREVGEHRRHAIDSLVRVGNTLGAMAIAPAAKARLVRLQLTAWDRIHDWRHDLAMEIERQHGPDVEAYLVLGGEGDGNGEESRPVLHLTRRRLVMDRRRWAELGADLVSGLEHAREVVRLVGPSATLATGDRLARDLRWADKLRSALDGLVCRMEPTWGRATAVFYHSPGSGYASSGLGPAEPSKTIAAFFNP